MSHMTWRMSRIAGVVLVVFILLGFWYVADRLLHYHVYDDSVVAFLTNSNGRLNQAVVTAAVQARFPARTSSSEILKFAEQQGARCSMSEGAHKCMIGVGGAFCLATFIILEFPDGNLSRPVDTFVFEDGC
jgi:hypothetical protein